MLKLALGFPLSDEENSLNLALKYKLVTERTSLLALKENVEEDSFMDEFSLMNDIDSSFPLNLISEE